MEATEREGIAIGDSQPEECEVCCNVFDQSRRPRSLPCGHSFCNICIGNMIQDWHFSCPSCRDRHYAKSASQFPVNYSLEALIRKLDFLQIPHEKIQLPEGLQSLTPISRVNKLRGIGKLEILVQEQIQNVQRLPSAYITMEDILAKCQAHILSLQNDHKQQLGHLDAILQAPQERFHDLIEENMSALVLLEKRNENLTALYREGKDKRYNLEATMEALTSPPTPEEMAQSIAEADLCISIQEEWIKKCQVVISDNRPLNASKELLARTRNALQVVTLTDDVQYIEDTSSITMKDLLEMTEMMQYLLKNDLVFASHHEKGKPRYAKISYKENKLYLHHLQDKPPPEDAHVLLYNDVHKLVDTTSTLTFLDISWNGFEQSRLHVRLHSDTARGRQFALLCTALWGPTYANTRLLAVGNKGSPSEYVRGGDYQYNNGTGGASLLPGLRRGGEYWRHQLPGSVMAAGSWGDACSAQFIINTRNPGLAQRDDTIYGQVEDGLHVLNAAIKDARIAEVKVVDCGIVVSL